MTEILKSLRVVPCSAWRPSSAGGLSSDPGAKGFMSYKDFVISEDIFGHGIAGHDVGTAGRVAGAHEYVPTSRLSSATALNATRTNEIPHSQPTAAPAASP